MSGYEVIVSPPSPEEILHNEHRYMSQIFSEKISSIKYNYQAPLMVELNCAKDMEELEKLAQKIINSYDIGCVRSNNHSNILDDKIEVFNLHADWAISKLILAKSFASTIEKIMNKFQGPGFHEMIFDKEIHNLKTYGQNILNSATLDCRNLSQCTTFLEEEQQKFLKHSNDLVAKLTLLNSREIDIEGFQEHLPELPAETDRSGNCQSLIESIHYYYNELYKENPSFATTSENLLNEAKSSNTSSNRLELIRDHFKLAYLTEQKSSNKTKSRYYPMIDTMIKKLSSIPESSSLILEGNSLKDKSSLETNSFLEFQKKYQDFVYKHEMKVWDKNRMAIIAKNIAEKLIKKGYRVALHEQNSELSDLIQAEETIYFDTNWDGYQVMLRLNKNGKIVTRLVNNHEIIGVSREKDIETGHSWCRKLDEIVNSLRNEGYIIDEQIKKSPEEVDILYQPHYGSQKKKSNIKSGSSLKNNKYQTKHN